MAMGATVFTTPSWTPAPPGRHSICATKVGQAQLRLEGTLNIPEYAVFIGRIWSRPHGMPRKYAVDSVASSQAREDCPEWRSGNNGGHRPHRRRGLPGCPRLMAAATVARVAVVVKTT